jgi:glutamine cyclotransferase
MATTKPRQRRKAAVEKNNSGTTTRRRSSGEPPKQSQQQRGRFVTAVVAFILGIGVVLALLFAFWWWGWNGTRSKADPNLWSRAKSDATTAAVADSGSSTTQIQTPVQQPEYTVYGSYELLETVPHDRTAFTQGLLTVSTADADTDSSSLWMYEGTGLHGESELRLLDIQTGAVLARHKIPRAYFGEGIAHYRDESYTSADSLRLIQLTWKERTAFEYALQHSKPNNLATSTSHPTMINAPVANWTYETTTTEGWGVTYSAAHHQFYVSDGSHHLHVWDATTKQPVRRVAVTMQTIQNAPKSYTKDATAPPIVVMKEEHVSRLNELEWDPATETVLANVWFQDVILRIDPITGLVRTIYDLSTLFPQRPAGTDVLNGIALTYDSSSSSSSAAAAGQQQEGPPKRSDTDQVWVTGKYWPHMYRIRLVDPQLPYVAPTTRCFQRYD